MHGWKGWVGLATAPNDDRLRRREQLDKQWQTNRRHRRQRQGKPVREASTDLARLDIAEWLAARTASTMPATDNTTNRSSDSGDVISVVPDEGASSDAATGGPRAPGDETHLSPIEQVVTLAEAMTKPTWQEISAELDADSPEAGEIKRQLAQHGWCDLLVGLIRVLDVSRESLDQIPDSAKSIVKSAILHSSMHAVRTRVTSAVVDVVVDKVWFAFKAATFAKAPLLGLITGDEMMRSLRILAVFTCPAPENHDEVRRFALKPLGDDVQTILTERTKQRLSELFSEWAVT